VLFVEGSSFFIKKMPNYLIYNLSAPDIDIYDIDEALIK